MSTSKAAKSITTQTTTKTRITLSDVQIAAILIEHFGLRTSRENGQAAAEVYFDCPFDGVLNGATIYQEDVTEIVEKDL